MFRAQLPDFNAFLGIVYSEVCEQRSASAKLKGPLVVVIAKKPTQYYKLYYFMLSSFGEGVRQVCQ